MSATSGLDLRVYWTTGPGSVPFGPAMTEPTLRDGANAFLHDAWMFLRLPLAAGAAAGLLGMLIAWVAMLLGLLH